MLAADPMWCKGSHTPLLKGRYGFESRHRLASGVPSGAPLLVLPNP
jgi:hypothetical protein